jgi:hypothetical protein
MRIDLMIDFLRVESPAPVDRVVSRENGTRHIHYILPISRLRASLLDSHRITVVPGPVLIGTRSHQAGRPIRHALAGDCLERLAQEPASHT